MIYTGIGNRRFVPGQVIRSMIWLAEVMSDRGYTLRSGAAYGSDAAFEEGCDNVKGQKEIYLPWKGFNDHQSELYEPPKRAFDLAKEHHPYWNRLSQTEKCFHARNTQQVLGELVYEPSDFVLCWTPDGCESDETRTKETGGTGQAISVASTRGIPVFNLKNDDAMDRLVEFLKEIE